MKDNKIARTTDSYKIASDGRKEHEGFVPCDMEAYEVAAYFGTDMENGLSKQQVRRSRMESGLNNQTVEYDESMLSCVKKQLKGICMPLMIVSLLICAVFTDGAEIYTPLAALLTGVMLLCAALERQAAHSLNKSMRDTALRSVALRDGKLVSISSVALVPGDIIVLESGSIIPADARLAETNRLSVLETPVSGVLASVEKDADYLTDSEEGGSYNMVYAGTIVTSGRAIAIVCRTGKDCLLYNGEREAEDRLPRIYTNTKKRLDFLAICTACLAFGGVMLSFFLGRPLVGTYMSAAASVACVMQGASGAFMLTGFSSGVRRMYKSAAVLKRPAAVDTLCVADTVMCDKTVAFPMSELEPKRVYINRSYYAVNTESREDIRKVMTLALLCSDVRRSGGTGNRLGERFYGMPADVSLARACDDIGINIDSFNEEYFRIEAEYDKAGEIHRALYLHDDSNLLVLRGKPEDILPLCAGYDAQGTNNRFDDYSRRRMENAAREMGDASQHVIAVASAVCDCDSLKNTVTAERRLVLHGFIGLYTSFKLDSASAVYKCAAGGIETVMLSEDAYVTAVSLAKHAGIIESEKEIMSSEELKFLDRGLYIADSKKYKMYLNLNDRQWLDVLNIRKDMGRTVAVTAHNTDRLELMKAADASFVPAAGTPETVKYAADVLLYKTGLKTVEAVLRASKMIYKRIVCSARQLITGGVSVLFLFLLTLITGETEALRLQDVLIGGVLINPLLTLAAALTPDHRTLLEDNMDYGGSKRGLFLTLAYSLTAGAGLFAYGLLTEPITGNGRYTAALLCYGLFLLLGLFFGAEWQHVFSSSAFKNLLIPLAGISAVAISLLPAVIPYLSVMLDYAMPSHRELIIAAALPLAVFALFQAGLMIYDTVKAYKTKIRKEKAL